LEKTQNRQRHEFYIRELDCAEEILQLRKLLEKHPGIEELDFDVLNARMIVVCDPIDLTPAGIVRLVQTIGMHASLGGQPPEEDQSWWMRQGRSLTTFLSGLFLLAGFGSSYTESELSVFSIALYGISLVCGGWFVVPKAWTALRGFRADMNLLMTVAVFGAMLLGELFEAAMVIFLFSIALLLEHWSIGRARRAIARLMELSPNTARCRDSATGELIEQPVESVALGSVILVHPGEKIPLDGRVISGISSVNEAPISGESVPVTKETGANVFAGTINEDGVLEIEVTAELQETALSQMIHLVQEAQSGRSPSEQWIEQFARVYTPSMMAFSLFLMLIPPLAFQASWGEWFYRGLVVLVVSCPCALVISTPVSIVSALTAAARNGVLIKGGRFLEAAAKIKSIALDKTGTITSGRPVVQQLIALNGHSERDLLERAAGLEQPSSHPLAQAIMRYAEDQEIQPKEVDEYKVFSGMGAEGIIDGELFWIGSHRFLHDRIEEPEDLHRLAVSLEDAGHSVVAVGNADYVLGLISLADEIREGIPEIIHNLKSQGIDHIEMLTGDNEETAKMISELAGIEHFSAELLPEEKLRKVELLRKEFHSVAMIGDGVNDAPAMAASDLGIAMGAIGTDTAIETADVALMSDDLTKVAWLISHARRTLAIIRQNTAFALGLKAIFVILTLFGKATLWMAIAADTGASLLVIFNALRLLRIR